ncbi:MAG: type II secretion system F family protein [Deltaproteobacteria bacterium]|nr:type II secretion system F family protein [Deltaproteobacteria bacterium]MBW2151928.1 type II secretion system F family protein [Deltaproteobacteria bacterium]
MPVFEYKALNPKGKKVSGIIDAEGVVAARQKLRGSGIYPISVSEVVKASVKRDIGKFSIGNLFTRVRPAEVAMMTRQLATLVGAGFPLVSAIDSLIPQTKSQTFRKILAHIKESVVEGNTFADSLSPYPGIFSSLYVNMVHASETSGTLEIVLERLADITEKQEAFKNRIRTALAYPLLMSLIGVLVLFLLLAYIVPNITVIFTDMNQALPAPTLFLIHVSDFIKLYWWVFLFVLVAFAVTLRSVRRTVKGRRFIDKIILFLPAVGPLSKKVAAARFSRTLGSLLENGVSLLPSLDIVKNIVGNVLIADAVEAAAREVGKGQGLGRSLAASDLFPSLCIQMIQVGEQSGELEKLLYKSATVFENEVESTIMRLTALLEPVMILVMGVIVGFIVLSICLPIFEMNQLIR